MAGSIEKIEGETRFRGEFSNQAFASLGVERWNSLGAQFDSCDFSGLHLRQFNAGMYPNPSHYRDCTFDGARINGPLMGWARFERCEFTNVRLYKWLSHSVSFVDCTFSGVLREMVFFGSDEDESNDFHGNDFSRCDLLGVGYQGGADILAQRLPAGPDYLAVPDLAAAVESVTDGAKRVSGPQQRSLEIWADLHGLYVDTGQVNSLQRETDWEKARPHLGELLRRAGAYELHTPGTD